MLWSFQTEQEMIPVEILSLKPNVTELNAQEKKVKSWNGQSVCVCVCVCVRDSVVSVMQLGKTKRRRRRGWKVSSWLKESEEVQFTGNHPEQLWSLGKSSCSSTVQTQQSRLRTAQTPRFIYSSTRRKRHKTLHAAAGNTPVTSGLGKVAGKSNN